MRRLELMSEERECKRELKNDGCTTPPRRWRRMIRPNWKSQAPVTHQKYIKELSSDEAMKTVSRTACAPQKKHAQKMFKYQKTKTILEETIERRGGEMKCRLKTTRNKEQKLKSNQRQRG